MQRVGVAESRGRGKEQRDRTSDGKERRLVSNQRAERDQEKVGGSGPQREWLVLEPLEADEHRDDEQRMHGVLHAHVHEAGKEPEHDGHEGEHDDREPVADAGHQEILVAGHEPHEPDRSREVKQERQCGLREREHGCERRQEQRPSG
jgi:hypothetical protein